MKAVYLLILLVLPLSYLQAQNLEEAKKQWDEAKGLIEDKQFQQAKPLLQYVYSEMERPLTAYYLGWVYDLEGQFDSASYYYKRCIDDSRKPMLKAHMKYIRALARQNQLEAAFAAAHSALKKYPDNKSLRAEFKRVGQWIYALHFKEIDPSYLTDPSLKESYDVKTVTHQELILDNIRSEQDESVFVKQRQYKGSFENWKCHWYNGREYFDIRFNLADSDVEAALKAQAGQAHELVLDSEQPLGLRMGALMALAPFGDKLLLEMLESPDWEVRLCACSELSSANGKKVEKTCEKDEDERVKAVMEE